MFEFGKVYRKDEIQQKVDSCKTERFPSGRAGLVASQKDNTTIFNFVFLRTRDGYRLIGSGAIPISV